MALSDTRAVHSIGGNFHANTVIPAGDGTCAMSVMSAISAINLLLGGLTAYDAGQLSGALLMAVLMFLLAREALAKARAA